MGSLRGYFGGDSGAVTQSEAPPKHATQRGRALPLVTCPIISARCRGGKYRAGVGNVGRRDHGARTASSFTSSSCARSVDPTRGIKASLTIQLRALGLRDG